MNADAARVVQVLTGSIEDACCSDVDRLKRLKQTAMERLNAVLAAADHTTSVGDESWSVDRYFDAVMKLCDWLDKKCDQLDPIGFVQSEGPTCGGANDPWP